MRRLLYIIMCISTASLSHAQTMRDVWVNMPDSVVPYLSQGIRTELADYVAMNVEAETLSLLRTQVRLDTLTADYLSARLSERSRLELCLFERATGGKLLCKIETFCPQGGESKVSFYDTDWQPVGDALMRPVTRRDLMQRPDTMSVERFEELCRMIEPDMVEAHISPDRQHIVFQQSLPPLPKEDAAQIKPLLVQISLKWDGETFK